MTTRRLRALLAAACAVLAVSTATAQQDDRALAAARFEARRAYGAGELDRAEELARRVLERQPEDGQMSALLALVAFTRAYRAQDLAALQESGRELERSERLLGAPAPLLDQAIAFVLLANGELDEARRRLDRALGKRSDLFMARWLRGRCELQDNQPQLAIPHLESAIELDPAHLRAHLDLAQALGSVGRSIEAVERLDRYHRRIEPEPADDRHLRTLLLLAEQAMIHLDLDTAVAATEGAVELAPDNMWLRLRLAEYLYRVDRLDEARTHLDRMLAQTGDAAPDVRARAHYHRGLVAKSEGEFEVAREHLERATELAPHHAAALQNLVAVLARLGERERARELLERLRIANERRSELEGLNRRVQANPYAVEPYVALADLHLAAGDNLEAARVIASLERRLPYDPAVSRLRARLDAATSEKH